MIPDFSLLQSFSNIERFCTHYRKYTVLRSNYYRLIDDLCSLTNNGWKMNVDLINKVKDQIINIEILISVEGI